jgi:phosphoribosyl 1,2-cyclic phosphate phosphodiesterase
MMKITFLGTGTSQGVPVIACACPVCSSPHPHDKRLRTSIHIQTEELSLVIDTGPDFRQQMLRSQIQHLDAVLFTHEHKDHTAGMDDIRAFNFKQKQDIPIYASEQVLAQLKREFAYIFAEHKYPGIPSVETIAIENKAFQIKNTTLLPIRVMHYKLPVFGFRIKNFTYITDANYIAPEEIDKIRGTEILVLNALQKETHLSHFTLAQALEMIAEIAPKQAYLVHMSHRMGLHEEVSKELPEGVAFAYDGLVLEC